MLTCYEVGTAHSDVWEIALQIGTLDARKPHAAPLRAKLFRSFALLFHNLRKAKKVCGCRLLPRAAFTAIMTTDNCANCHYKTAPLAHN